MHSLAVEPEFGFTEGSSPGAWREVAPPPGQETRDWDPLSMTPSSS
jgi:hypothetical protein